MHAEDDQLTIESDAVGLAKAISGRLRGIGVADPGFQSVLKLGATKNVWVKISARTATVLRARASRKRLIRCFAMPTASIAYCGAATGRTRRQRRVMRRIANFSTR